MSQKFTKFAWAFVVYLIAVILFGAWVRITGSGAGCGSHWPTCHGEIIPMDPTYETMVEYTHRLTSGFLGILSLVLLGWAYKLFGARHRVFLAGVVTFIFILFESAIGAGLVMAELVADNDSVARAIVIAVHLVNTLMLTGAAALCAWWSRHDHLPSFANRPTFAWLYMAAFLGLIVTCMTGAITALGDTLFPVDPNLHGSIYERLREDLSATQHFLVRLRIIHPVVSIFVALYLLAVASLTVGPGENAQTNFWAKAVIGTVCLQLVIGITNIVLAAPGWIQIIHLLFAQILWISFVLMAVSATSSKKTVDFDLQEDVA